VTGLLRTKEGVMQEQLELTVCSTLIGVTWSIMRSRVGLWLGAVDACMMVKVVKTGCMKVG
jgi:hypothetical protein